MTALEALLLGILEGLTEFLPVSSTGHLVLLGKGLGHEDDAAKSLSIVIQLGAVVAVVVYYRTLLLGLAKGILRGEPESRRLVLALGVAFVPAAGIGLLFGDFIKAHLLKPVPVAIAAILGGLVMIGSETILRGRKAHEDEGVMGVRIGQALAVGIAQCFALWPGMSRSMTTILGGQLVGLKTATAAEFSFLLSIPVLGAATVYDLVKSRDVLLGQPDAAVALGVGLVSAFVVSLAVIAAFLKYLKRIGLIPFGVYRVLLGIIVLVVASRA
jgi:undecaprenyl-diphosphatase